MPRIINTPPASGGAMPPKSPWHSRPTGCEHPAVLLLLFSVAMLMASPEAGAAEASTTAETPPSAAGPLTPVRREPPATTAQSAPASKQAKKPTITMPPPASMSSTEATPSEPQPTVGKPQTEQAQKATPPAPAPKAAKPQPKQAEEATPPRPHRKAPPTKTASTASDQPEKKIAPAERRAEARRSLSKFSGASGCTVRVGRQMNPSHIAAR